MCPCINYAREDASTRSFSCAKQIANQEGTYSDEDFCDGANQCGMGDVTVHSSPDQPATVTALWPFRPTDRLAYRGNSTGTFDADLATALAKHPRLGTVVGTDAGALLVLDPIAPVLPPTVRRLENLVDVGWVSDLAVLDDWLVVAGETGVAAYQVTEQGQLQRCPLPASLTTLEPALRAGRDDATEATPDFRILGLTPVGWAVLTVRATRTEVQWWPLRP